MARTMFDQGFRPGATVFGVAPSMGSGLTDAFKKYSMLLFNPTNPLPSATAPAGTVPLTPLPIQTPEATIMGMPQSTFMWGAAAVLGLGVVGAIVYSQKAA